MSLQFKPTSSWALKAVLSALLLAACAPQMQKMSGRNPDLFEKESDRLEGRSRGNAPAHAPEMYVKEPHISVKNLDQPNESGSLFNPDDERNYLFTSSGPLNVGRFLKINVVSNRADGKNDKNKAKPDGATKGSAKDKKAEDAKADALEEELLKGIPSLAPAAKGDPALVKNFKMQIVHRFPNGDVLARVVRRSTTEDAAAELTAEARIPYDRLASGEELTTEDLLDVKFHENKESVVADRASSGWEDEYSLRLSGFNEAKSKMALELADQKQKLDEGTQKVNDKIKAFGAERRQFAKEREELNKKKAETENKVKGLEDKVQEQQGTIDDQQTQIKDLTPDAKPGDSKEGNNG